MDPKPGLCQFLSPHEHTFSKCLTHVNPKFTELFATKLTNIKVKDLTDGLDHVYRHIHFKVFVMTYGCKHPLVDFVKDYADVFENNPDNMWDLTMNMFHKNQDIIMFKRRRHMRAGID